MASIRVPRLQRPHQKIPRRVTDWCVIMFLRLGKFFSDQVQERRTFGFKGHDSYYDLTQILWCLGKKQILQRNIPPRKWRCMSLHSDTESIYYNKTVSNASIGHGAIPCHIQNQLSQSPESIKYIQTRAESYPTRDVFNTVKTQLRIARKRVNPIGGAVNRSSTLYGSSRLEIKLRIIFEV